MGFFDTLKNAFKKGASVLWRLVDSYGSDDTNNIVTEEESVTTPNPSKSIKTNTPTLNDVALELGNNQTQQWVQLTSDPLWQYKAKQEAEQAADTIASQELPNPTDWFIGNQGITVWDVKGAVEQEKRESKRWFWANALNTAVDVASWITDFIQWLNASSDYDAKKKQMAMYYDKDSDDVYYLDINTSKGLADWDSWAYDGAQVLFDKELSKFSDEWNANDWDEVKQQEALQKFYNNTKNLFRLKADDYYSDGWIFTWDEWVRTWRRKDQYSQETLDKLANNNIDTSKKYVPTFDEFKQYISMYYDNQQLQNEIYWDYWLDRPDDNKIDLSESATQRWKTWFYDTAMSWVVDYAKTYLDSNKAINATLIAADAVTDQQNRIYNIVAEVYKKEQLALAKPEQERNEWDKYIIETADKLRQMEVAYAKDFGDVIKQNIRYWRNGKWDIVENLDIFEWGKTLNEALTDDIKQIAWGSWSNNDSAIDVFQEVANRWLFEYNYANDNDWAKAWDYWQRLVEHSAGTLLSEIWQQFVYWVMWARNLIYDTFFDWNALGEVMKWNRALSTTANYADNDATILRLLQTDMWNNSRTIYKYWLQGTEYVPETVGNLAPDIALAASTWWGSLWVSAVRWWAKTNKAIKAARAAGALEKLGSISKWSKVIWLKWLEKLSAWLSKVQELWNKYPWWRTLAQMTDRAISQWLLDQTIDAQWSQFDTEPYSRTSLVLSLTGTWLGELLPIAWKWGRVLWSQFSSTKDILWYIKNNPQAVENIAKSMNIPLSDLNYEDLYKFLDDFEILWDAAKQTYKTLSNEWKIAANQWTKKVMYNYLNQVFDLNNQSMIAKNIRRIVTNGSTNPADLFKYVGRIAWTVELGPYVSTIQLKNGTKAAAVLKDWEYDVALDQINGWFASKISDWFTQADLNQISEINAFKDILEDKAKYFREVDGKYYLSQEGLDRFGLKAEHQWLESLWISLAEAENVRELFREKMKAIREWDRAITDETVDAVADSWAYTEVVDMIKEIVC